MLKQFTNRLYRVNFLIALLFSASSLAGKDDFTKEINIASNYQEGDGIAKKFQYRGNVLITQGSLTVKAEEVELDASKGEGNEIFVAIGKPAEYSQKQEDGSLVTAKADRIEYRLDTRSLFLEGNAEIKQNTSSVQGKSITFNMELEQIIAQGSDQESGRVITTFQPLSKPNEPETDLQDEQP
jgi:lipopolysaccharide export system protein LptA